MTPTEALDALLAAMTLEFVVGHGDTDEDPLPHLVVQPGTLAVADWCSSEVCWQVFGRVDSMFPSKPFPLLAQDLTAPIAATFQWGTFRCVQAMGTDGEPPDPVQQTADAALLMDDAHRIACALKDAARRHWPAGYTTLGTWTPLAEAGGCAGGYWPITVWLHGPLKDPVT